MRVRRNLLYHTQLIKDIRELVIIAIIPCDEMPNAHATRSVIASLHGVPASLSIATP